MDLGYLKEQNVIFVKKEDLDNYAFLEDFKSPFKEKESNYPNVSYSMDATDKYPVKIKVESISKLFPDEMVDSLNNDDFRIKR